MAWYLAREYGDTVQVSYIDLSKAEVRQRYPEVIDELRKGNIVLPAVRLDGETVNMGYVDYFSVSRAIDKVRGTTQA